VIQRGDLRDAQALGQGDHRGVRTAERQVSILADEASHAGVVGRPASTDLNRPVARRRRNVSSAPPPNRDSIM